MASVNKTSNLLKKYALGFTGGRKYSIGKASLTKPQWYVAAMVIGGIVLLPFGGLGIAAFGTAIGVSWWIVGAIAGLLIARDRLKGR